MQHVPWPLAVILAAPVMALIAVAVVHRVVVRLGRHSVVMAELASHSHRAFQVFCALLALRVALLAAPWWFAIEMKPELLHFMGIGLIITGAWLVGSVLLALEDAAETRYRVDVPDNRQARRVRTQILLLRRVTIAAIVVITLGLVLMTFPQVRAVGASLLASAGVIGIVAALAAQSVLGNVIAGLQLAFSDAIRLDDVVVVEGEWARVEEITLSHVVLQIWDDRRLILPTSYFTTKPYQNWTRTKSEVLGAVEFDVDWTAPIPPLRDELRRLVESSDLWDGRVCVLQVTDAVGGLVRLRALVSAGDAPRLWDLRCLVREHLIAWVRDQQPEALPRRRAELAAAEPSSWRWVPDTAAAASDRSGAGSPAEPVEPDRVFGGSDDGQARGTAFAGPEHPEPILQETVLDEQAALDMIDEDDPITDSPRTRRP